MRKQVIINSWKLRDNSLSLLYNIFRPVLELLSVYHLASPHNLEYSMTPSNSASTHGGW